MSITVKEIKREGWFFSDYSKGEDYGSATRLLPNEEASEYNLMLSASGNLQIMKRRYLLDGALNEMGGRIMDEHIWNGPCPDLETFRTIIKLLGI